MPAALVFTSFLVAGLTASAQNTTTSNTTTSTSTTTINTTTTTSSSSTNTTTSTTTSTSKTNTTSTVNTTRTYTSTSTSTNTTIDTYVPPSIWYNPQVADGNTTTTTTTANTNNVFHYKFTNTFLNRGDHFTFFGSAYAQPGWYMFTGVAASLTAPLSPGDTKLVLSTINGFLIGDMVLIGSVEICTVTGFPQTNAVPPNVIEVTPPIKSIIGGSIGGRRLTVDERRLNSNDASVIVINSGFGGSGGDPVAVFGNERREFWLPVGLMHPLIQMPEMSITGATFAGEGKEQWFGRLRITSPGGFKIAEISIRKNLDTFNKSRTPKRAFETLDVTLGDTPMLEMPAPDAYFHRDGVYITFMRMSEMKKPIAHQFKIQGAHRDVVMIACKTAHFVIAASPASEFDNWRPDLSVKYAHVDIIVLEVHRPLALKGIMPELWGMRPMSNRTKSLLEPIYIDAGEESHDHDAGSSSTTTVEPNHSVASKPASEAEKLRFLSLASEVAGDGSIQDAEEDGFRKPPEYGPVQIETCSIGDGTKAMPCVT